MGQNSNLAEPTYLFLCHFTFFRVPFLHTRYISFANNLNFSEKFYNFWARFFARFRISSSRSTFFRFFFCFWYSQKIEKKRKRCKKEEMKNGREKGSKSKNRVRDIQVMKNGVRDYQDALDEGETSKEYQNRTGISKSKIFGWGQSIKNKEKQ